MRIFSSQIQAKTEPPFGSVMQTRNWSASSYRYGFNGKEKDDETQTQDYGMRIYDQRLGRFLSIDPITGEYPELTPYQFASNTPIQAVDLDGLEATRSKSTFLNLQAPIELSDNNMANKPVIRKTTKDQTKPVNENFSGSFSIGLKTNNKPVKEVSASINTSAEVKVSAVVAKKPEVSVNKVLVKPTTDNSKSLVQPVPKILPPNPGEQRNDALSIYNNKTMYSTQPSNTSSSSFDIGVASYESTTNTFFQMETINYPGLDGTKKSMQVPAFYTTTQADVSVGFLTYGKFDVIKNGMPSTSYDRGGLNFSKGVGDKNFGLSIGATLRTNWIKKGN